MKEFFNLIGASNRAKIRHLKIEINVHSLFLGYFSFPTHTIHVSRPLLAHGAGILADAINMMAEVGGSLVSFEVSRSRQLIQTSHRREFTIISPKRISSDDSHNDQYPSYMMFEAEGLRGMDAPLGRSIRNLKGAKLICKEIELWDHGRCDKPASCHVCMQIKGFKIMRKEMLEGTVSSSLALKMLY